MAVLAEIAITESAVALRGMVTSGTVTPVWSRLARRVDAHHPTGAERLTRRPDAVTHGSANAANTFTSVAKGRASFTAFAHVHPAPLRLTPPIHTVEAQATGLIVGSAIARLTFVGKGLAAAVRALQQGLVATNGSVHAGLSQDGAEGFSGVRRRAAEPLVAVPAAALLVIRARLAFWPILIAHAENAGAHTPTRRGAGSGCATNWPHQDIPSVVRAARSVTHVTRVDFSWDSPW